MFFIEGPRTSYVIGPSGAPLSLADLPPAHKKTRWIMRRKAEVVVAVHGGLLSLEEAHALYGLSPEEFLSWQRVLERHGLPGLRATRVQQYGASSGTQKNLGKMAVFCIDRIHANRLLKLLNRAKVFK